MIRLQKAIADAGFTSRRKAEDLIRQGRVFVNDKRADLGDKVSIGDNVYIDGKKINTDADNEIKILIYNKPLGCLLYTSPSPRDTRRSRMPSSA